MLPSTKTVTLEVTFDTMDDGTNHAMFNQVTYNAPLVPTILSERTLAENATVAGAYGPNHIVVDHLKVFDIVRTMTGGQFDTSVVANEFYSQSFWFNAPGLGAALAVLLFVLVIPIVAYNIVQMRKEA